MADGRRSAWWRRAAEELGGGVIRVSVPATGATRLGSERGQWPASADRRWPERGATARAGDRGRGRSATSQSTTGVNTAHDRQSRHAWSRRSPYGAGAPRAASATRACVALVSARPNQIATTATARRASPSWHHATRAPRVVPRPDRLVARRGDGVAMSGSTSPKAQPAVQNTVPDRGTGSDGKRLGSADSLGGPR